MRRQTLAERFWAKVDKSGECWEWTASKHHQWRYGHFRIEGKTCEAHRVSWELYFGPIPDGMKVCHECDNPPCVRPSHLFLGTDGDNVRDRDAKGRCRAGVRNSEKTHCPQGHEYTPQNTRTYRSKQGWTMRFCIECDREGCSTYYAKNRRACIAKAVAYSARKRAADPEGFKRRQRDYMRARRAAAKRVAA